MSCEGMALSAAFGDAGKCGGYCYCTSEGQDRDPHQRSTARGRMNPELMQSNHFVLYPGG